MRKGSIVLIAVTLLIVAGLMTAAGASAQQTKILKVGTTLPLNFGFGVDTKNALEMLVENFNVAGGIKVAGQQYKIEFKVYDDKYKAEEGRAAYERLIYQDQVKYVISTFSSAAVASSLDLVESEKVLHLTGATTAKILEPKLRYTFGLSAVRTSIPAFLAGVRKVKPDAKTMVLWAPNDESGKARSADEKRVAEAMGFKVLDMLYYPRDTVDFTPLAVKAVSLKPDLMDAPGAAPGTQMGLQMKALHAAGFKGTCIQAGPSKLEELLQVTSKESVEGYLLGMYPAELDDPPSYAKEFKDAYIKKFKTFSDGSLAWLGGWYGLLTAMRKVDSIDPTVLADAIAKDGLTFVTASGTYTMVRRPDVGKPTYCDTVAEPLVGQVRNGKAVFLQKVPAGEGIAACEKVFGGSWK